jgi:hypothetical protein
VPLRVAIYRGVRNIHYSDVRGGGAGGGGNGRNDSMTQRQLEQRRRDLAERSTYHLARCDIVLTTYKALRDDLGHDTSPDAGEGKGARGGVPTMGGGRGGCPLDPRPIHVSVGGRRCTVCFRRH